MNIDERLEELVRNVTEFCGCDNDDVLCVHDTEAAGELERHAPALAQALLRARQALNRIAFDIEAMDNPYGIAEEALADTELEEATK